MYVRYVRLQGSPALVSRETSQTVMYCTVLPETRQLALHTTLAACTTYAQRKQRGFSHHLVLSVNITAL